MMEDKVMLESLDLGEIPFYWRVKKIQDQQPNEFPVRLPFSFAFINELQLVIQKRNPVVLEWLARVYMEDANVGYLQDGHALAESYGGEFIEFFTRASKLLARMPKSAADIGCGGVYLLKKVRELGLSVKGIDPSPVTAVAGRNSGIDIIPDFYPSPSLSQQFDVLFHYDVLEHVEDPVSFLAAHHRNLTEKGAIVFAVPDCTHHIRLGDVSMVLHEHLNYFDEDSLDRVVRAAGFRPLLLESSIHGGVLLCCAVPEASYLHQENVKLNHSKFLLFCKNAHSALQRFADVADRSKEGELGLYVPLRAFPYLTQLSLDGRLRFFDDDPGLLGHYYDGFDVVIENREKLVANPPTQLMVCSLAFGDIIAERLHSYKIEGMQVVLWTELFEEVLE